MVSIIEIVSGALSLIAGLMATLAGGVMGGAVSSMSADQLAEAGVTAADAGMLSVATSMMAVILIVAAAVSILEGVLGIRAANDASKIMPVWILAIIGLVGAVITIIVSIANGSFAANAVSNIITLVIDGLMFWIANNIKTMPQKAHTCKTAKSAAHERARALAPAKTAFPYTEPGPPAPCYQTPSKSVTRMV